LLSGAVAAQEAIPLTQDQAVALLEGNDLDSVTPRCSARFKFKDDATLSGVGSVDADNVTYTIEDGRLCLKWVRPWLNKCSQLAKVADGTVSPAGRRQPMPTLALLRINCTWWRLGPNLSLQRTPRDQATGPLASNVPERPSFQLANFSLGSETDVVT